MLWAIVAMSVDDPRGRPAPLEAARGLVAALPSRGPRRRPTSRSPGSSTCSAARRCCGACAAARRRAAEARGAETGPGRRPRTRFASGRRRPGEGRCLRRSLLVGSSGAAASPSAAWGSFRLVHLLLGRSAPRVAHARRGARRDVPAHGRRAGAGGALDRSRGNPHRPLADVVAAAPARRSARRLVSGADDLPARHGARCSPCTSRSR